MFHFLMEREKNLPNAMKDIVTYAIRSKLHFIGNMFSLNAGVFSFATSTIIYPLLTMH